MKRKKESAAVGRARAAYSHAKVGVVMHEFKAGTLHSGSKHGPIVQKKTQAVAIALEQARKAYRERKK